MLLGAGVAAAALTTFVRHIRHTSLLRRTLTSAARKASTAASSSSSSSTFRMALCQLSVTSDKAHNLKEAAKAIQEASKRGAHLISLPECFQSPYATDQFEKYAETIPDQAEDIDAAVHPSDRKSVV